MNDKSSQEIAIECDKIKDLLLEKNLKYGDSALNPIRVFSHASSVEQLLVRIDDKLSRISKGAGLVASDEDVIQDLIGYLILLKIALKKTPDLPFVPFGEFPRSEDGYMFENPWKAVDSTLEWGERCPD